MSQTTPEGGRPSRADRKAARRGTKAIKAAATLKRRDRRQFDPALREAIGRSNLTAADLSAMIQRGITGTQSGQARADLAALGQAAQGRIRAPRTESPTLGGMVSNAISRWKDLRRGTKLLKAAGALAAKDAKTVDPAIRAQLGHSTMTRGDLAHLAQRNLAQAFRSPGDFEVEPGVQAPPVQLDGPAAQGMIQSQRDAERGPVQQGDSRLEALLAEMQQLNERLAVLEQQVAEIRAAQDPQEQSEEQSTEAQSAEAQSAEAQSVDAEAAEVQSTEGEPAVQEPGSEHHVGQHEAVPTDKTKAQEWVGAAAGENQPEAQQPSVQEPASQQPGEQQSVEQPEIQQPAAENEQDAGQQPEAQQQPGAQQSGPQQPAVQEGQQQPRGTAQPVFQAAGGQPTTTPGQAQRPQVQAPTFQAAGEQPNEVARKEQAARAAAAAFYGTADVRPSTREQAAKTAQSDPNKKSDRGAGQSTQKNNDPNSRGSR